MSPIGNNEERNAPSLLLEYFLLSKLKGQGFTHLVWRCAKCGMACSRGLRLMRIRRQFRPDATIATIIPELKCPKCHQRPNAAWVHPAKAARLPERQTACDDVTV